MPTRFRSSLLAGVAVAAPLPLHAVWQRPAQAAQAGQDVLAGPAVGPRLGAAPAARRPSATPTARPASTARAPRRRADRRKPERQPVRPRVIARARAAADPDELIYDFSFSPGMITISAGATITWTNSGPSAHTATARDGAFNTGVLQPGQSGSHTFTRPGTFHYFCQIHPFMHGTIVVLAPAPAPRAAAPSPRVAAAAGGAATPRAPSTRNARPAPTLALTGLDLPAALAMAFALLGFGVLLRRLVT